MSVPGVPRIFIRPRTDNGSISFYWNPPLSDGGSAITSYTLDCPNDPSAPYTISPSRYTYDVSGLFNTVQYTYTIAAVNGNGTGPIATYRTVRPNMNELTILGWAGPDNGDRMSYQQPDPTRPGTFLELVSSTPTMGSGKCRLSSTGTHIAISATMPFGLNVSHTKGASWSTAKFVLNTGNIQSSWNDIAISDNGKHLIGCASSRNLMTSKDGGIYWIEQPRSGANNWRLVCCSTDASVMYAFSFVTYGNDGGLYKSTDYGLNWKQVWITNLQVLNMLCSSDGSNVYMSDNFYSFIFKYTNVGLDQILVTGYSDVIKSFAVSSDGQTILVGTTGNTYMKKTTDGGANWTDITGPGTAQNWYVAMSSDGTYMTAAYEDAAANQYHIYRSTNGGSTWTGIHILPGIAPLVGSPPTQCRMSADGSTQIVYTNGNNPILCLSSDYGATWATLTKTAQSPFACCGSLDGTKLYYISFNSGVLYSSTNSGASWTEGKWFNENNLSLLVIQMDCSDDGSRLYVAEFNTTRIWRSSDSGATWTATQVDIAHPWQMVVASSTGQYVAVAGYAGGIYYSSNYGVSYTAQYPSGTQRFWYSVAMSPDGTKLAAAATDRVYISTNSGTTWTQVTTPTRSGDWKAIGINSDGTKLTLGHFGNYPLYTSTDSGVTWTQRTGFGLHGTVQIQYTPTGDNIIVSTSDNGVMASYDGGATWTSGGGFGSMSFVAKSSDGTTIVSAAQNRSIIRSTDSGSSWTEITIPDRQTWSSIACSSDGNKLVASVENGTIWVSSGVGLMWTPTAAGNKLWRTVSSSATGAVILAGVSGEYLYTSSNTGATWTARTTAGSRSWRASAVSSTGAKMVAAAYGGSLWTSTDTGATWTERTGPGSQNWSGLASSSDGSTLVATVYAGSIWTSTDSGATWTERSAAGTRNWISVCCSSDGTKIAAAAYGGSIWTSSNTGAAWTERTGPGTQNWADIRCSSTGSFLIASVTYGGFWMSRSSGARWTAIPESAYVDWRGLACSSDGSIVASTVYKGSPWVSGDSGITMRSYQETRTLGAPSGSISRIQCSKDGQYVLAQQDLGGVPALGYLWVSADYGRNWSLVTTIGYKAFRGITVSDTGAVMYVATLENANASVTGYIYKSSDYGRTWTKLSSGGSRRWASIYCSSDGAIVFAAQEPRQLFRSENGGTTWQQAGSLPFGSWLLHNGLFFSRLGNFLYAVVVNTVGTDLGSKCYKSINNGNSWIEIFNSEEFLISSVSASLKGDRVLITINGRNSYYSTNYGGGFSEGGAGLNSASMGFILSAYDDPGSFFGDSQIGNALGVVKLSGSLVTRWLGDGSPYGLGMGNYDPLVSVDASVDGSYIFLTTGYVYNIPAIYRCTPPLDSGWIVVKENYNNGNVYKSNYKPTSGFIYLPPHPEEGGVLQRVTANSVNDAGYSATKST